MAAIAAVGRAVWCVGANLFDVYKPQAAALPDIAAGERSLAIRLELRDDDTHAHRRAHRRGRRRRPGVARASALGARLRSNRAEATDDGPIPELRPKRVLLPTLETPTLTKAELAELLFERLGLNKRESKDMVEAFFDLIHATLLSGDDVKMSGFGNFNIRRKAPRPGRNPRTGESIPIKARNVVTFHASHKLKGVVQGDTPIGEEFE